MAACLHASFSTFVSGLTLSCAPCSCMTLDWISACRRFTPRPLSTHALASPHASVSVPHEAQWPVHASFVSKPQRQAKQPRTPCLHAGKSERARGARRTRPFRLAEIRELWSEAEGVGVCAMRWALEQGVSREELRGAARDLFDVELARMAAELERELGAVSLGSSSGPSSSRGPGSVSGSGRHGTDAGSSGSSGDAGAGSSETVLPVAAWLAGVQPYRTVREAVTAVLHKHSVVLLSTLPHALTAHLITSQGLSGGLGHSPTWHHVLGPAESAVSEEPEQSTSSSNSTSCATATAYAEEAAPPGHASTAQLLASCSPVQGPGLVVVQAARWSDGVQHVLRLLEPGTWGSTDITSSTCSATSSAAVHSDVQAGAGSRLRSHPLHGGTEEGEEAAEVADVDRDLDLGLDRLLGADVTSQPGTSPFTDPAGCSPVGAAGLGGTGSPLSTSIRSHSGAPVGRSLGQATATAAATSVSVSPATHTLPAPLHHTASQRSTRGASPRGNLQGNPSPTPRHSSTSTSQSSHSQPATLISCNLARLEEVAGWGSPDAHHHHPLAGNLVSRAAAQAGEGSSRNQGRDTAADTGSTFNPALEPAPSAPSHPAPATCTSPSPAPHPHLRPQLRLHLGEWGGPSMSLRARALATPGVGVLDEGGLAQVMGCTDSRAVMDGIAWGT